MKLRASLSFAIILLVIYLGIRFAFEAHYGSALGIVLAGFLLVGMIFNWPDMDFGSRGFLTALFSGVSLIAVVTEMSFFDSDKQAFETEMLVVVANSIPGNVWQLSQPALRMSEKMMMLCSSQPSLDAMHSLVAAEKAIYFGPGATVVDTTVDTFTGTAAKDYCMAGFSVLYKERPAMFTDVIKAHQKWFDNQKSIAEKS
jgi:hypothetical protein